TLTPQHALEDVVPRSGFVATRILLHDKVRDRGIEMHRGSRQDWPQEVVGNDGGVETLSDRRDFLRLTESAGQANIRSHVLAAAGYQHLTELPDRVHPLPVRDRRRDATGDLGLRDDAVNLNRIFDEQRIELRYCLNHRQRLEWGELAMQLQDDVEVAFDRLARGGDHLDDSTHELVLRHV